MEIKTYEDLQNHLLATIDSFTDQMCKGNSGVSKEHFWNMCMNSCYNKNPEDLVGDIIRTNVLREFPEWTRSDYEFPAQDENTVDNIW